jgi:hypothetical protein
LKNLAIALMLLATPCLGQDGSIIVGKFGGLNDTDPSATLQDFEAQDALNVESPVSGNAVVKRGGYSRIATLTVSTSQVNGSFSFFDASGNRLDIVCHDHYCAKSTNGAAFSVFLSTAGGNCVPTRWSFVAVNGNLFGGNDCRDPILSYDGTTRTYPATMPKGSVLELTKDRLVITDVASNPNRVYYSQSGTYTNFTTGINSADPYTDDIGTPGDKNSGLKYAIGRLLVFKTSSITGCLLGDQYSSRCAPISNVIGTSDPLSVIEIPGAVQFRGADRNFWQIDNNGLTLLSRKISGLVAKQNSGSLQSNTQNTQAAWLAGTASPSASWDASTIPNSIFNASFTFSDTSSTTWNLGTFTNNAASNMTNALYAGAIPSAYNFRYDVDASPDLSTSTAWFLYYNGSRPSNFDYSVTGSTLNLIAGQNQSQIGFYTNVSIPANRAAEVVARAQYTGVRDDNIAYCDIGFGKAYGATGFTGSGFIGPDSAPKATIRIKSREVDYYIGEAKIAAVTGDQIGFSTYSIVLTTAANGVSHASIWRNGVFKASSTISAALDPAATVLIECNGGGGTAGIDLQTNLIYFSTNTADPGKTDLGLSTFTSRIFDTAFSTPTAGPFTSTVTTSGGSAVRYAVRSSTSPNNDKWDPFVFVTPPNRPNPNKRYWQYQLYLDTGSLVWGPEVDGIALQYSSTGTFRAQCIQAGANITAWGLLSCSAATTGAGSLVYYATAAYSCAAISTQAVTAWPSVSNGATLSIGVSSAVVIGFSNAIGSSTDTTRVDACQVAWTNGIASPPVWGMYDSAKNSSYWTVAINNSASNNRVLKYDLNLEQWYPFGLNANAPRSILGTTYFGDSTGGYWNQSGIISSDNGAAINAYWKSKDFSGGAPFQDKEFKRLSFVVKNQTAGSMTVTYTPSYGSAGSYSVSLATTTGVNYLRANNSLPKMSPYEFLNVQFGNNSMVPFEVDALGLDYFAWPWKPQNP